MNEQREGIAASGGGAALEQLLLSASSEAAKEAAAAVFEQLAMTDPGSPAFDAAAAAIGTLVSCLETSNMATLQSLLTALALVANCSTEHCTAILAAGVLPQLHACLNSNSVGEIGCIALLVRNLAVDLPEEQSAALGAAGTIPAMVQLLQDEDQDAAENAAWALYNLSIDCPANQLVIQQASGGFTAMCAVVQKCSSDRSGYRGTQLSGGAAMALWVLAWGSEELRQQAVAAGCEAAIERWLSSTSMPENMMPEANEALLYFSGKRPVPRAPSRYSRVALPWAMWHANACCCTRLTVC